MNSAIPVNGSCFSAMTEYERLLTDELELKENTARYHADGRWTERHLQCVWYNDNLRPQELVTDDGETVIVESCGRWNLESGPDFLDAALIVGPERRRIVGDIEIHIRPSGWTQHCHSSDPRYANIIAHITYFPGPRAADLPKSALAIPLRAALQANPRFSFDDIDLSAYPHAVLPSTPRPCQIVWGEDPDKGIAILKAAGLHRLDVKRRRMADLIDASSDPLQAFFESVMAALGYKQNTQNFRDIARAYPLTAWTDDKLTNYARLLGIAGLLPDPSDADADTVSFLRDLWDRWWHNPVKNTTRSFEWKMNSVRPLNHPVRRLAAAAAIFSNKNKLNAFISSLDPAQPKFVRDVRDSLSEMASFAEVEPLLSLTGKIGKPTALLGSSRAAAIAINTVIPFIAATRPELTELIYTEIPSESISAPMRTMANRLFGRDHNPCVLYSSNGLCQQGLLQIFSDFCLNARGSCADCRFGKLE